MIPHVLLSALYAGQFSNWIIIQNIKVWFVGVAFGIVATLTSNVDTVDLPNDNGRSFETRREGKLFIKVLG